MAWTREERAEYRRQYRQRLRDGGGRRVDLHIDGRLDARLRKFLGEYGYMDYPGHAILSFLEDEAPRLKGPGIK